MVIIMQLYMKDQLIAEIDENRDSATKISKNNGDLLTYKIHIKEFKKAFSYRYASKPFQEKGDIGQQRIDIRQHRLIIDTQYKPTPRRTITKNDTFYLIFESYDNESKYIPIMLDKCLMIYPKVKVIENEENKLIKQHSMMQEKIDEMQEKIEAFGYVVEQFNNENDPIKKLFKDINKCNSKIDEHVKLIKQDEAKIKACTDKIDNLFTNLNDKDYAHKQLQNTLGIEKKDLSLLKELKPDIINDLLNLQKEGSILKIAQENISKIIKVNNDIDNLGIDNILCKAKGLQNKEVELSRLETQIKDFQDKIKSYNTSITKILHDINQINSNINKTKDFSYDPKDQLKISAKNFYNCLSNPDTLKLKNVTNKSLINLREKLIKLKNNSYKLLPKPNDTVDDKWFKNCFSSLYKGIEKLKFLINRENKIKLEEIHQFIDDIDLNEIKQEATEKEKESFKNDQWKSVTPYELLKEKFDIYLQTIKKKFDEERNQYQNMSDDDLKKLINDFLKNDFLPFIEMDINKIKKYHEKIDKKRAKSSEQIEVIKNELLKIASLEIIEVKEKIDKYDSKKHLKMGEGQDRNYPDRIVLNILRVGYYCKITDTIIQQAGVEVNYNFSG